MNYMNYIKCKFCNELCNYNNMDEHMDNCNPNWNEEIGLISCYSCGELYSKNNKLFSSSQLNKQFLARCKDCVKSNKNNKYAKYVYNYKKLILYDDEIINILSLNKQLEYYIKQYDYMKVIELLKKGANPNYVRQMTINNLNEYNILLYNENGLEKEEIDIEFPQPKTPLRLCIFFLCNLCNTETDYQKLYEISKSLVNFGANKEDALYYYKLLYNDNYKNNLYKKIYNLIN
jgi:hypothetical protein